jgi:hypothetical protein
VPGSRDPPKTSVASARKSTAPATQSAASPPGERRAGHRAESDNTSEGSNYGHNSSAEVPCALTNDVSASLAGQFVSAVIHSY